jgi:5-methyltetrahydropteroyltriglutamate--homocysteine methyltransferase
MTKETNDYGVLFPASVVGSMPRSDFVRDLIELESEYDAEAHVRAMDSAVRYIVALQERAGVDIITDGEWRRRSYIGIVAELARGFELTKSDDGRHWTTVVEPLTPGRPGAIAEEVRFVRGCTDRMIKATLPSPYLLGQRMWDAERSRSAYPTRQSFMEAVAPFLRQEAELLAEAGATIIQIDDPHLCLFVDSKVRDQYDDPDREADLAADLINRVVDGLEGVKTAVHLCRRNKAREGWVGEGGYGPILPQLKKLKVDQYVMEFTIPAAGDLDVLAELPDDREIGLGCVDCRGETIDSVETIVGRVQQAMEFLEPERISLNPDCGFAPGSAAPIPIDEAYAKLKNEATASARLRDMYG